MAAIDFLKAHGFSAKLAGNRLRVSPRSKLTVEVRHYIKLHRLELLAEVAANDGDARRSHWIVAVPGRKPFHMVCEPITYAEALADVRSRWPECEILEH